MTPALQEPTSTATIRVDMVRCVAHGICAHVFDERITLDQWGFPMLSAIPLEGEKILRRARRAARACPRRALLVSETSM